MEDEASEKNEEIFSMITILNKKATVITIILPLLKKNKIHKDYQSHEKVFTMNYSKYNICFKNIHFFRSLLLSYKTNIIV